MWPGPQLAPEAGAKKARNDSNIFRGHPEHLRQHVTVINDCLGRFIKCERLAIPNRNACMQLDGIMGFNGSPIGFIELDRGAGESPLCVSAGTIDPRLFVRIKTRSDVRLLLAVAHLDGGRSGLCLLKGLSNDNSDVLTVVTNDIVFEGRPSFVQVRRNSRGWSASEQPSDVPPMVDSPNTRHLLSDRAFEAGDSALANGAANGNGIEHAGKVVV